jgi:hypothetical protein
MGSLSVAYVGSHTERQTILQPYNDIVNASATPFSDARVPDQIFGGIGSILRSTGWSNYESFQVKLIRAFTNGLAYNAAYTYSSSKAFSNCGDFSTTCIQNPYNTALDYGPSELSVPNVFTFNTTYVLPFGKGQKYVNQGAGAAILGGWHVNGILAIRSGTVVNPVNGSNGDAANVNGGSNSAERINITGNPESGAPHKRTEWWNSAVFSLPAAGTFGTARINSLRGPGYWSPDFSLFRDIGFGERYTLQLRFESFDLFNHPNLANPSASGAGNFNTITNTVSTTGPGAQRDNQLALKLTF